MAKISVDDLEEGMQLAEPVLDQNGQLLLPAGSAITSRELRLLSMWGVFDVTIGGGDDEPIAEELSDEAKASAEAELGDLFLHVDMEHPFMQMLHGYCVKRIARQKGL